MNLPTIVRNGLAVVTVTATLVLIFAAGCPQSRPQEAKRETPACHRETGGIAGRAAWEIAGGVRGRQDRQGSRYQRRSAEPARLGKAGKTIEKTSALPPLATARTPTVRSTGMRPTRCDRKTAGRMWIGQRRPASRRPPRRPTRRLPRLRGRQFLLNPALLPNPSMVPPRMSMGSRFRARRRR